MKPLFVVLYLGRNKLEVTVEDDQGRRRRVNIDWGAKEASNTPPANWPEMVERELQYQQSVRNRPDLLWG